MAGNHVAIQHEHFLPAWLMTTADTRHCWRIAAGIITIMSIPLAKWHIPFGQNGSHPWTSGSAS
jgi:hypothetical protein